MQATLITAILTRLTLGPFRMNAQVLEKIELRRADRSNLAELRIDDRRVIVSRFRLLLNDFFQRNGPEDNRKTLPKNFV